MQAMCFVLSKKLWTATYVRLAHSSIVLWQCAPEGKPRNLVNQRRTGAKMVILNLLHAAF
jgi:hypothetical protein